jgi:hypothetical protein
MSQPTTYAASYRFENFYLDARSRQLWRDEADWVAVEQRNGSLIELGGRREPRGCSRRQESNICRTSARPDGEAACCAGASHTSEKKCSNASEPTLSHSYAARNAAGSDAPSLSL